MKKIRLTLKVRIIIAVVAIAAIHAAFTFIPPWWDARPRFYPDAWAEADSILREEVGNAAVDKGLFFIPKDKVRAPRNLEITLTSNLPPQNDTLSDSCLVCGDTVYLGNAQRLARVSPEKARHVVAVFAYLRNVVAADQGEPPEIDSTSFFYRLKEDSFVRAKDDDGERTLVAAVRVHSGLRYCERLQNGALPLLDQDEEIGRLAYALLQEVIPPRTSFQESLAETATDLLDESPCLDAVDLLKRMISIQDARDSASRRDWLRRIPVIGRLFAGPREDYDIPSADYVLTTTLALGGKSPQERVDFALNLLFGEEKPSDELENFRPVCYLVQNWPDAFRERVIKEWPGLTPEDRGGYFRCINQCGTGIEAIAALVVAEDDEHLRAKAGCVLCKTTGESRFLDECIGLMPLWDKSDPSKDFEWTTECESLRDLYKEDRTLKAIPDYFSKAWLSLPQTSKNKDVLRHLPIESCFTTLTLAGRPDTLSAAVEILDVYADPPVSSPDTQFCGGVYRYNSIELFSEDTYEMLVETADPACIDAMLAYLQKDPSCLMGRMREAYTNILAKRGDMRVLPLIEQAVLAAGPVKEPEAKATDDIESNAYLYYGGYSSDDYQRRSYVNWLYRSAAEVRITNAPDPLAHLLASTEKERTFAAAPAAELLAARFTESELLALLADDTYAPIRMHVFLALCNRRYLDREAATASVAP